MKKYLLIDTYSNYGYDDDDLSVNSFVLGDFETLDECAEAVKAEIISQANENAMGIYDLEEGETTTDSEIYVYAYCDKINIHVELDDNSFAREGANRMLAEHWYNGGNYLVENQFLVIRVK